MKSRLLTNIFGKSKFIKHIFFKASFFGQQMIDPQELLTFYQQQKKLTLLPGATVDTDIVNSLRTNMNNMSVDELIT